MAVRRQGRESWLLTAGTTDQEEARDWQEARQSVKELASAIS